MTKYSGDLFDVVDAEGEGPYKIVLRLQVRPGAGSAHVVGRAGAAIGVQLAAPPASARATEASQALVAEMLGIEPGAVTLVGSGAREHRFEATVADLDLARERIATALDEARSGGGRAAGRRGR